MLISKNRVKEIIKEELNLFVRESAISKFASSSIDQTADKLWNDYWIPAKPIVKIARGLGLVDNVNLRDKKQLKELASNLFEIQKRGVGRIKEASMDLEKNFKWAKKDELKVIQFLIGMSHGGISDVVKDMKKNPSAFKSFVKDLAKQGLYEGFAGAAKLSDRKHFEKLRKQSAEVLGYTLTGTSDVKTEIGDATIKETAKVPLNVPKQGSSYKAHFSEEGEDDEIKEDYKNSEWEVYVGDDPYGKNRKVVKVVKSRRAAVILYNKLIKTDKYAEVGMRVVKEAKLSEGVADEIRKQIPRRTMSYVGARNFAKGKTSKGEFLEFSVKGSRLKTGGKVRVTYNKGGDDYTIEAFQIRGTNVKLIKKKERIQVSQLARTIENLVG